MGTGRRHDLDIHLEERAFHPDGVGHSLLAVERESLGNRVNDFAVGGQMHRLSAFDGFLDIIGRDFFVGASDV